MRGHLSLKSKIYPGSMDVYVAGISGKVSAQYPGRSALCLHSSYPRRMERTEDVVRHLTAVQKSAEGIVSLVFFRLGRRPEHKARDKALAFDGAKDADKRR